MKKIKKRSLLTLLAAACLIFTGIGISSVSAAGEKFDGTTNLATDSTLWSKSAMTNASWYTVDEKGIVFTEYGTGSAVGALSLKESLPYEGTIAMTFNSETTVGNGFLKVVFADNSGSANGLAMKPWEISGSAEHVALEIQKDSVFLWQYNAGNVYGAHVQQTVTAATTNYIDGNDHLLTIEYAAKETAYELRLSIDETVHFNGTIASTALFCNSILTLGGYGNSTVTDKLTIGRLTVKQAGTAPAPVVDEDNLLGKEEEWTVSENESVIYDPTAATLTSSAHDGAEIAVMKNALPSEAKIDVRICLENLPEEAVHSPVARFRILGNETGEVVVQLDDDGNVWIIRYAIDGTDKPIVSSAGEWIPGILAGTNTISVSVIPELTDGDEDIFIRVSAAGKTVGLAVDDLSYMNGNRFSVIGGATAGFRITSVKIEDLVKEKPADAKTEKALISDASGWSYVSSVLSTDKIELGSQDYLVCNAALPVNGEVTYTVTGTADCDSWYYFGFGNFKSSLWDAEEIGEGQARFRIVTTGSMGYYVVDMNGVSVATASPNLTQIYNGEAQTFSFLTEKTEEGLTVTMKRNGTTEFTQVYANDSALGGSECFYLTFRATGVHTKAPVITNVVSSFAESGVPEYNAAIAVKRAVYALCSSPDEENAFAVKQQAEELIAGLTDDQKEIVNNVAYARYVIAKADAVLAVVADKAAAKAFSDKIAALNADYTTITGENVGNAKADVARLREEYDSLPENVKAYVTDYGDIETVEIRIDEFERQQNESSGSQSESQTEQSSAGAASSESTQSAGCLGSLSGASLAALFALAGVALLKKKND